MNRLGSGHGIDVIHLAQADSTNSRLKELNQKCALNKPTIMTTDHQFSGRGTRGRQWQQEAGKDIAFTLALPAGRDDLRDPRLSMSIGAITAASLEDSLRRELVEPAPISLKWPNDILAGDPPRKLGGILLEMSHNWIYIGIGLNINSTRAEMSEEINRLATSLLDEAGQEVNRNVIAADLVELLAGSLGLITLKEPQHRLGLGMDYERWISQWQARNRTAGIRYRLLRGDNPVVTARSVSSDNGELTVVDEQGTEYLVSSYTDLERLVD